MPINYIDTRWNKRENKTGEVLFSITETTGSRITATNEVVLEDNGSVVLLRKGKVYKSNAAAINYVVGCSDAQNIKKFLDILQQKRIYWQRMYFGKILHDLKELGEFYNFKYVRVTPLNGGMQIKIKHYNVDISVDVMVSLEKSGVRLTINGNNTWVPISGSFDETLFNIEKAIIKQIWIETGYLVMTVTTFGTGTPVVDTDGEIIFELSFKNAAGTEFANTMIKGGSYAKMYYKDTSKCGCSTHMEFSKDRCYEGQ